MARRKTGYLSDGESSGDSAGDSDVDAFDGQRKRQKRAGNGKHDALYGVFAEDDDDGGLGTRRERGQRVDFTKAPAFTSASTSSALAPQPLDNLSGEPGHPEASDSRPSKGFLGDAGGLDDEYSEDDEDDQASGSDASSDDSEERPASPRIRDDDSDEEDELPSLSSFAKGKGRAADGAGLGSAPSATADAGTAAQPGSSLASGPAPKAGFFAAPMLSATAADPGLLEGLPSAFQPKPKQARSFLPKSAAAPPPPTAAAADLSREDMQALNKLQGSFGARMLSKLGWSAGSGLGKEGEGIIAPIDVKLRPQKMGLGGVKERTEQSIKEAIRKGDMPAPEEKKKPQVKGGRGRKGVGRDADAGETSAQASGSGTGGEEWKRRKKLKSKVVHLTYEEILEQSGGAGGVPSGAGLGVIIDATGATPREISSLAHSQYSLNSLPQATARLPELRHNLRTIASQTVMALEALAKEGVSVRDKRVQLGLEEEALRRRLEAEAVQIARLQTLQTMVAEISEISKSESSVKAGGTVKPQLEAFDPVVDRLVFEFGNEFEALGLDEVVVGAIAPAVKRLLVDWRPLEEDGILPALWKWRKAFRLAATPNDEGTVDVYGRPSGRERKAEEDREMTPYESLIWNVWLPRVRSAINNDWSPFQASPAIYLYTTWSALLPQFVKDNILDQLILPKLSKAVNDWKPRRDGSGPTLSSLVFPWLEVLQAGASGEGGRGKEVLEEGKRRMRGVVKGWRIGEDIPAELLAWKKVFSRSEWDSLLLKYVLPKLGSHLRTHLAINPRAQSLAPLEEALKWKDILRSSMMSQLLEGEFVGKWLDVLYIWLVSPKPNFDEVTQWYSYWKTVFPEDVLALKGVQAGFRRGLDLMNQAMSLGSAAASQLPRPSLTDPLPTSPRSSQRTNGNKPHARRSDRKEDEEITFRSLAEAFVTERDLIWAPTGRSDLNTGQLLFRISRDGRTGGIVGYVSEDAFYLLEGGGLDGAPSVGKPVSLDEVVRRAKGGK